MILALELDPYAFPCDGPVLGVPHGWNVLTNLPFLLVGAWGILHLARRGLLGAPGFGNWTGLWVSTALLGFGSGAYHLWLTPWSLGLDRACIAGIMAFVAAHALAVTAGVGPDRRLSLLLLAGAQASVLVWALGGTSLVYGGLQAVGGLVVLALFVRSWREGALGGGRLRAVSLFLGGYALAKVAELLDGPICELTGIVGGHPLKHLLAAAALLALGDMMQSEVRQAAGGDDRI